MIGCICRGPNIENLLKLKKEHNPKVYAEIGVLYGGSIIEQMKDPNECIYIGIDPFTGYYGKEHDPHRNVTLTDHIGIVKKNIDTNNPNNHNYKLIKGNSESEEVLNQVKELTEGEVGKIDFLFIDGDHSAEGVERDFYNYFPYVSQGGLILFDNYNDPSWTQVKPAVDKVIDEYIDRVEIVEKSGHLCVVKVL
jgi:cephalosporin hydroxylase